MSHNVRIRCFAFEFVELERRDTPAITVRVDYSQDASGFFNDPARRVAIERATAMVASRFQDTLAAIVPSGNNTWTGSLFNAITNKSFTLTNPVVGANEIVLFAAGGGISGSELAVASGGSFNASGSTDWLNNVRARGQVGALSANGTDVSPWGGFLAFDSSVDWNFSTSATAQNQYDFTGVAEHELLHVLGFGLGDRAFDRWIVNGAFTGPSAVSVYGSAVPMNAERDHWAPGTAVGGQPAIMVSSIPAGINRSVTELDYAAMRDIGWQVSSVVPPIVPPVIPPVIPPIKPPPAAPPGAVVRFVVGSGKDHPDSVSTVSNTGAVIATVAPFFGSTTGGIRVASADFNGDGVKDVVVGTGPGTPTRVRILDGKTLTQLFSVEPFETAFTGGVYVAAGDVNGDGTPDLVVAPDEGGGPRVRVFDGKTFGTIADFFGIDDPNFRGGARPAIGDINGDGVGDLVVAAGFGGGPRVAGYNGKSLGAGKPVKLFGDFFAFEQSLRNGIFVAIGDIDGDGKAELICGGGPGGGPRVTAFPGQLLLANVTTPSVNFFAGDINSRGGVRLAIANLDDDHRADLIVGSGEGDGSHITGYAGRAITLPLFDLDVYPGFNGGVFVG